jgi:acyl-CoA dehydrogenase
MNAPDPHATSATATMATQDVTLFELGPELTAYGAALRAWAVREVRPHARAADERHGPPDNWKEILDSCPVAIGRRDQHAKPLPEFTEGKWVRDLVITEALTYGDLWVNDVQGSGIGHLTVKIMGTADQIERWYRPIVRRGGQAAFALTEPGFGSDTSMVSTTATRDGDTWVINGTKMYCSGGATCEYVVVFANVDKSLGASGIKAFVVESGTPGMVIAKANEDKLGIRSWQTTELLFDDCAVPVDHQLGWLGDEGTIPVGAAQPTTRSGRGGALGALAQNKPNISAMGLGITQAAIDLTRERLDVLRPGFTDARWAKITNELDQMDVALHRIRRVNWGAQSLLDRGMHNKSEASVSKAYGPPTFERVIRRCMQFLGPDGSSKEFLLEKWYRDVKILDIFEGSAQVQRIIIGRTLMGAEAGRN